MQNAYQLSVSKNVRVGGEDITEKYQIRIAARTLDLTDPYLGIPKHGNKFQILRVVDEESRIYEDVFDGVVNAATAVKMIRAYDKGFEFRPTIILNMSGNKTHRMHCLSVYSGANYVGHLVD